MKISDNGINLIANFEGLRTTAYKCPAGVLTIGIGETGTFALTKKKITQGMTITEQQAKDSFRIALERYETAVNNLGVDFNQNQFDALVSFCYNLGTGIFTGNLLNAIKNKNWDSVASQLLLYNKARVNGKLTVLKGLQRRREAESKLFKTKCDEHKEDELFIAVSKIIKAGYNIDFNSWKRLDLMKTKNMSKLFEKLGGVDKLIELGAITPEIVRLILIEYSSKIG